MSEAAETVANDGVVEFRKNGRFVKGCKPGPGRPKGSPRNDLSRQFILDLQEKWGEHGINVLDRLAREQPEKFAGLVAKIIPQQFDVAPLGDDDLDDDELANGIAQLNRFAEIIEIAQRQKGETSRDSGTTAEPPET